MMEFVNGAYKWESRPRAALEPFILLLSPYAPHLGERAADGADSNVLRGVAEGVTQAWCRRGATEGGDAEGGRPRGCRPG